MIRSEDFGARADRLARMTVPYLLVLFMYLGNIIFIDIVLTGVFKVPMFLMALFYWSIYRPTLLPTWLVFILGLLFDIFTDYPLGMNTLIFLLIQWLVRDQRKYLMSQNFVFIFFSFALVALAFFVYQWLLFGVLNGDFISALDWLLSFVLTVLLFPLAYIGLLITHKILPDPGVNMRLKS